MVSWYLIERACFSSIRVEQITERCAGFVLALTPGHDLVKAAFMP